MLYRLCGQLIDVKMIWALWRKQKKVAMPCLRAMKYNDEVPSQTQSNHVQLSMIFSPPFPRFHDFSPQLERVNNRAESYTGFIKVSNYHPSLERIDKTAESCTESFLALNHGATNEGLSTTNMPILLISDWSQTKCASSILKNKNPTQKQIQHYSYPPFIKPSLIGNTNLLPQHPHPHKPSESGQNLPLDTSIHPDPFKSQRINPSSIFTGEVEIFQNLPFRLNSHLVYSPCFVFSLPAGPTSPRWKLCIVSLTVVLWKCVRRIWIYPGWAWWVNGMSLKWLVIVNLHESRQSSACMAWEELHLQKKGWVSVKSGTWNERMYWLIRGEEAWRDLSLYQVQWNIMNPHHLNFSRRFFNCSPSSPSSAPTIPPFNRTTPLPESKYLFQVSDKIITCPFMNFYSTSP